MRIQPKRSAAATAVDNPHLGHIKPRARDSNERHVSNRATAPAATDSNADRRHAADASRACTANEWQERSTSDSNDSRAHSSTARIIAGDSRDAATSKCSRGNRDADNISRRGGAAATRSSSSLVVTSRLVVVSRLVIVISVAAAANASRP